MDNLGLVYADLVDNLDLVYNYLLTDFLLHKKCKFSGFLGFSRDVVLHCTCVNLVDNLDLVCESVPPKKYTKSRFHCTFKMA